ncbi:MAG: response regulator transcription factor [Gemmatimonadaceae bacterium]|nr:response regulator transcription factor [Gemmatimonadaceae bacterium]
MIRVALADDHAMLRQGLGALLSAQHGIAVAGEAGTADELFALLRAVAVDVLVLDVSMPGPGLSAVLAALRADHPAVRTIVLSMYPEEQYAARALKSGAMGYLTKDRSPEHLVAAVRKVAAGGRYVTATLAEHLAAGLGGAGERAPHEALSEREFAVLQGIGAGRSMKELSAALGISPKTASTYRVRVLEKLGATSNAELVRYALRHGLVDG